MQALVMLISTFGSCNHNTSLDKRSLASFQVYLLLQSRRKQSAIQKIHHTKPCLVRRSMWLLMGMIGLQNMARRGRKRKPSCTKSSQLFLKVTCTIVFLASVVCVWTYSVKRDNVWEQRGGVVAVRYSVLHKL